MAFPADLLKKVDALAKAQYTTRSDYIRQATVQAIKEGARPTATVSSDKDLKNFSKELDKFMDTYDQDLKNLAKR
jgi:uncharacterized FlaG/YvyC family protein